MIGVILGNAFDRAIGLTLRHWRIVIFAWIILGCAYIFDQTPSQTIDNVLGLAWIPIPAILAAKSQSSEFSFRASSLVRFYVASLLWFAATGGLLATFAAILIPNYLHARDMENSGVVLELGIIASLLGGMATSVWIGNKWSLAPTIALYRLRPISASFGESWALTTGKFWQTLMFNVAATLAYAAVWLAPFMLISFALGMFYHNDGGKVTESMIRLLLALLVPLFVYGGIAEWIAYFRWLEWLESVRVKVPRDASSARRKSRTTPLSACARSSIG